MQKRVVAHHCRLEVVPAGIGRIVVVVEWSIGGSVVVAEIEDEASEGFARAEQRVISVAVANLLSFHSAFLVSECQGCKGDATDVVHVIQRSSGVEMRVYRLDR